MNILIINGYQKHDFSKGDLNFSLVNVYLNHLRSKHNIQLSSVMNYNVMEERNKFLWADLIIYQFPIYWFSVPGKLKLYMDEVFEYNQFYSFAEKYGAGGLMKGKSYILSTTWNAPKHAFKTEGEFFGNKDVDDVLLPIHKTMQFCGFTKRKSISFHNVVKDPQYKEFENQLIEYIKVEL
ncbi:MULTISPECIES: NAD(P)H-dependent oxidoreductase [Bacillus]|jgi:modulator of drug activity B|uniref:NAD(P)H-dependent oxidoreductase n=1 Tax=Bacillus TaxID=1386 RepID=UPI000279B7CE|nr:MULTISPECIES: NAD(P)H-dependent oxidoreductase [Bacillus]EJR82275.1 hypothetical protein IKA_05407 [Bacillus cereus VD169]KIQ78537.1 flavodoxin [Bacillus sp. L_1B0_8]KIQ78650.1 flavodoxin [Bacillus sp. L_1B0_5]MDA2491369.1 NAD(P)H-dependent oxidoreductase [Bacillus cereus]MDZ4621212.1 NAD(P)H-dependent oxidoreductase [Bacillus cereus]